MAINCAPLHTALLLYWYEGDFNFIFRYIDDVFLLSNRFDDSVDRIYHMELETKNTTDTATSHAPRNRQWSRLVTKLYDKGDYFNIPLNNFPFICSNIPSTPAYGVYISWLILYSRAGISSQDFQAAIKKATGGKVPIVVTLTSSFLKFYDRHHDLYDLYKISVSLMITDMFRLS